MEPERIREMLGADLYAQVKEKLGEKHLEIMDPQENRYVQREELEKARKAEKDAREQLQSVNGVLEGLKKKSASIRTIGARKYAVFSKEGFAKDLTDYARRHSDVTLVSLRDICSF